MANNVYVIAGQKYAFDEPLTPAELRELEEKFGGKTAAKPAPAPAPAAPSAVAAPSPAAPKKTEEPSGTLEYLLNAARRGVTGTTSLIRTAQETGAEMMTKLKELEDRARREGMGPMERLELLRSSGYYPSLSKLAEKYGEQQRVAARVTGAKDLTAPGPVTEIIGAGVEAATDPFGLAGKLKLGSTLGRAGGEFLTGVSADIAGRGGAAAEKAVTGEDTGISRLIASLAGGAASASQREALSNIAGQAIEKARQVPLRASSIQAEEDYAKGAAKRLLEFAAKEQGAKSIDEIIAEAGEASRFAAGKEAPILVAMADNPVIRQQVIRLAKSDPVFRQQVNETLASLRGDMRAKVEKIFGVRYEAGGKEASIFEPGYVPGKEPPKGVDVGNIAQRREALTRRIEDIASGFEPTKSKEEIGTRIESLVEDKKKLARQEVSPEYESLLADARSSGVKMPPEGVGTIYDFVRQNNLRDIFGKGTDLDRRIMGVLAPKEMPVPGTVETVTEHLPMSFDNVESLKKAINELKRQRMSEDSMRKVLQLEEIVDEARKTIPGDFSDRLNAIDLKYYEKVGVPFGAQGVKDIDSKKYATQVAPIIVKNSESFDQFIRAVGKEQGHKIAEDSIISEIYDRAIKNGELNPGALAKYIKTKEGIIRQIPGLEEKLRTALSDDSALRARIKQLDDAASVAEKRIADNALTKFDAPNYNALTRSFMTDPKAREKLLRDIGDLDADSAKAVRRTLRAEVIALADENPAGFMDYLMNPANKDALDKIFGSAFQPALRKVGLMADKLSQADISKVGVAVTKEDLDPLAKLAPGLDIPYISSTFRDRITSLPQKIVRLMSRVNSARLLQKTDETIKELLLDPNGVQKLANVASEIDFSLNAVDKVKKLGNAVAAVLPRAFYTSGKTAVAGEEREQRAEKRQKEISSNIVLGGFEDETGQPSDSGAPPISAAPEVPEEGAETGTESAEPYSYESLTSNQVNQLGRYLDSLGINKDFLLNAQTFNATPIDKRKQLFARIQERKMGDGGLVEPGNIDVSKLPKVRNPDGSYSTVLTIGIEQDGKHYVIPTVINGRVVSKKEAVDYFNETHKHLGAFSTRAESDAYAQKLHEMEAKRIAKARGGVMYTPAEEVLLRRYASS